ncbi:hypothetical protein HBB16_08575 [Pseudonocardia sp. MCCB 268]|nr:hypothetical protein [Pseudonocardia cytotoxica]
MSDGRHSADDRPEHGLNWFSQPCGGFPGGAETPRRRPGRHKWWAGHRRRAGRRHAADRPDPPPDPASTTPREPTSPRSGRGSRAARRPRGGAVQGGPPEDDYGC